MQSDISSDGASWATKTYDEVCEVGERDGSVLVIPVGSIEQHGHHLPVATDTLLVDAIAELGAERVADDVPTLVTPTVWSGFSPHHMPLGGTLTLEFETLLTVVEELADAGLENGFDAVVLLNGHGGNISLVNGAVSTIGSRHPDVEVVATTYFQLAASFVDDVRDSDPGGMAHAGEFETSLMLYLYPDLVGEDRDATMWEQDYERASEDMFDGGPVGVYRSFDEYAASGAIGDPDLATAEKGERIYELLGDELESVLRNVHEQAR